VLKIGGWINQRQDPNGLKCCVEMSLIVKRVATYILVPEKVILYSAHGVGLVQPFRCVQNIDNAYLEGIV
jgi:hypothetical protein